MTTTVDLINSQKIDRPDNIPHDQASPDKHRDQTARDIALKAKFLARMGLGAQSLESMSDKTLKTLLNVGKHGLERVKRSLEEQRKMRLEKSVKSRDNEMSLNFFLRTDEEVRASYVNRLNMIKPRVNRKPQTIIIFDWDDTLLCSTFLENKGVLDCPWASTQGLGLGSLDEIASKLLSKAVECGTTFIITNSDQGWIEESSKLYLPKVYQVLKNQKVGVISARAKYQKLFPNNGYRWKLEAFLSLQEQFCEDIITNIICMGDLDIEICCAEALSGKFRLSILKTIKLLEGPNLKQLVKQLDMVYERFENILTYPKKREITLQNENSRMYHNMDLVTPNTYAESDSIGLK